MVKNITLQELRDFRVQNPPAVGFSPTNHNGSSYVELTVIGKDLSFKH